MRQSFFIVIVSSYLSACLLGPDYNRPEIALPGEWDQTNTSWVAVEELSVPSDKKWWSIFREEPLSDLVNTLNSDNYALRAAQFQVEQALSLVGVQSGSLFPEISVEASAIRRGTSGAAQQSAGTFPRRTFNSFLTSSVASWELDLWGRVRREKEALTAEGSEAAWLLNDLKLSLQTQLVTRYFQIRSLRAQVKILKRTVALRKDFLTITRARFTAGETAALDVERAKAEYALTKVALADRKQQVSQFINLLSQLLSTPSLDLTIPDEILEYKSLQIPRAVPSELVRQRPDVRAQEQRVIAANSRIGVAQTAFFPRLSLAGAFGNQAAREGNLFSSPSRFWSLGPSLTLPLFRGGANVHQLSSVEASYKASVEQYKAVVLNAFIEVQNALIQFASVQEQLHEQKMAWQAARRARVLSETRYESGLVSYLEVIDAQRTELQAELALADLIGLYYVTGVDLMRALGGSWIVSAERKILSVDTTHRESDKP